MWVPLQLRGTPCLLDSPYKSDCKRHCTDQGYKGLGMPVESMEHVSIIFSSVLTKDLKEPSHVIFELFWPHLKLPLN